MLTVAPEVADALASGGPVVALESTIIAHGLPAPRNLEVAREIEAAVRSRGAVPATIALFDGAVHIGLPEPLLERLGATPGIAKCGIRDLAPVLAAGGDGATTVSATSYLAAQAGIRLFGTGGLGGVHRGAAETFDESADLVALARLPICVVCAGVKSILDVGATLERLETLSVTVLGYGTDAFAGFYRSDTGFPAPARADSPEAVARVLAAQDALGISAGVMVANPLPAADEVDAALHDRVLAEGLAAAEAEGIAGKAATPFLLGRFHRETGGESLRANVALVLRNVALAADIAVARSAAAAAA